MEKSANNFEELAPRKRSTAPFWIVVILIVVAVILGWKLFGDQKGGSLFTANVSADYQAVFLTNNQVYFGKLTERNDKYAVLTDIFYLQVSQPLQPSQPNPNVNLIKLGSELHGPADRMEINRDQILFIETLKADSQVVKGIEKYKADNKLQ
ncbi:MAG: hypothetical protein V1704_04545 [Candidatus Vogelbacteria bacterium]